MLIVTRILILVLGLILGAIFLKYRFQLTRLFGHNSLAEKYLGAGGTYTMWQLLGIATMLFAAWLAFR